MRERVRRLLQPTPTTRSDSFKWSDKRPIKTQVVGGVRKAVGLVSGFAVLFGMFGGMAVLSETQTRGVAEIVWWCGILGIATAIMFVTANRWSPFVAGFFFGPAIFPIAFVLVFGTDSYYSAHAFSRVQAVEVLFFALTVVVLTARFVGTRPAPTTLIDRFALTFFALAMARQIVIPYRFPSLPLSSGLTALLIAWLASRRKAAPNGKTAAGYGS